MGTYSTIFVASALLILLERRFGSAPVTQPQKKQKQPRQPKKPKKAKKIRG